MRTAGRLTPLRVMVAAAAAESATIAALGVLALGYLAVAYQLMAALALTPVVLAAGAAWAWQARSRCAAAAVVAVLVAAPVGLAFTDWPVRAAFAVSRPALDRLADRAAAGGQLDGPEWAGLFLVRKVARPSGYEPGAVALILAADPSNHTRFVRPAGDRPAPSQPPYLLAPLGDGAWWHHEID